jgi:adrenodoxin-NADP+ reductase
MLTFLVPQVSFTAKELREMFVIPDISFKTDNNLLSRTLAASQDLLANDRPRKRLMGLLEKGAQEHSNPGASREWELMFLRSPRTIKIDTSDRVTGIQLEVNEMQGSRAVSTDVVEDISCGLVFRSIGYKSVPVDGLPFDHGKGIVPNNRGRVLDVGDVPEKVCFISMKGVV